MRGRRRAAQTNNRGLLSVFIKGWLTDVGKLKRLLPQRELDQYEKGGAHSNRARSAQDSVP